MFTFTRGVQVALGLVGLACAGLGCRSQTDFYARSLVVHMSAPGDLWLASLGSDSHLMESGRIDAARRIRTPDGIWIDMWLIHGRDVPAGESRGTVLLIHGLTESRAQLYRVGQRLADRGFDVVLPDLRAHGRSTGVYTTFGPVEAADLNHVLDRLLHAADVSAPIYVVGISLGGGTAVHVAAGRDDCRGVVALAPVGDVRKILRRLLLAYAPLMGRESVTATIDRAGEMAGFDVDKASSVEAARRLKCPIVVVHGTLDAIVPIEHGRRIHEAAPEPKRLDVIPWVGHAAILLGRTEWIADQVDAMARGEFRSDTDEE